MNSIKEKMENFRKGEKELEEYLQWEREKNRYDPRPDLSEDHEYWQLILKEAKKINQQVYSNLHGFRIVGCRLQLENNRIKLLPGKALGNFWPYRLKWKLDRQKYLLPYKKEIKNIFEKVARNYTNRCQIDVNK